MLVVPVVKAARIFTDNYKSYIPLLIITAVVVTVTVISNREEGNLYIKGIIDIYIATVSSLQ